MNVLLLSALSLLSVCGKIQSFSVDSATVQGDGKDADRPAKQGSIVTLKCGIQLSADEEWTHCTWIHVLTDEFDQNGRNLRIVCNGVSNSHGNVCDNRGGSHVKDDDAKRIKLDVSQRHCGLVISSTAAQDSGQWDCTVMGTSTLGGEISPQYNSLDLYVSNMSTPHISDPDVWANSRAMVTYDLASSRPEIRVKCRGYGGLPAPTFRWFINSDRKNEIKERDYEVDRTQDGRDVKYGNYLEQSISFKPSLSQLCNYDLHNECGKEIFTFELICKTEQSQQFFTQASSNKLSKVLVEVRGAAQPPIRTTFPGLLLLLWLVSSAKL